MSPSPKTKKTGLPSKWFWGGIGLIILALLYWRWIESPRKSIDRHFRVQLPTLPEILSLDGLRGSSGHYLHHSLSCPLLWLGKDGQVLPYAAKFCRAITALEWVCLLSDKSWSTGEPLTAQNYVQSFQHKISPNTPFFRKDLLLPLKNARDILDGKKPPSSLGVEAKGEKEIRFSLEEPMWEWDLALTNPLLSANIDDRRQCGPFQVLEKRESSVKLIRNPSWKKGKEQIHFLAYGDENLALRAFEQGSIDLLYRLPIAAQKEFQNHAARVEHYVLRMDSIFLRPHSPVSNWGMWLVHALDYEEWQKIYNSPTPPGCWGLPEDWWGGKPLCVNHIVPKPTSPFPSPGWKGTLYYSKAGGADHERAMQFLVWRWNHNLEVEIIEEGLENKTFLDRLEKQTLDLYRRGLALERPTCLAALEWFAAQGNMAPIPISLEFWETGYKKMRQNSPQSAEYKRGCYQGLKELLQSGLVIPTGKIHFQHLVNPEWKGWFFNSLNHLNLLNLEHQKTKIPHHE